MIGKSNNLKVFLVHINQRACTLHLYIYILLLKDTKAE